MSSLATSNRHYDGPITKQDLHDLFIQFDTRTENKIEQLQNKIDIKLHGLVKSDEMKISFLEFSKELDSKFKDINNKFQDNDIKFNTIFIKLSLIQWIGGTSFVIILGLLIKLAFFK